LLAPLLGCAAPVETETVAPTMAGATGGAASAWRRPDAVPLEASSALPPPRPRAEAQGVVALVAPPTQAAVVELLHAFVDAWRGESIDALAGMLTADAGPFEARARGRTVLVEGWRARMRAHPYARLEGFEVFRAERVERWTEADLGKAGAPSRPPGMLPGEIFVRAPLEMTRVGTERVFGDVLEMILRSEDGKLRIAAYGEADAP
jgi:hypothetical protein